MVTLHGYWPSGDEQRRGDPGSPIHSSKYKQMGRMNGPLGTAPDSYPLVLLTLKQHTLTGLLSKEK